MAFFNEINAGRYNRFIQKLFNMKGGPPARQLASDVTMVFPFFSGAEHRFLESWNRYAVSVLVAGVAANTSAVRIRNPSTSGVIAVLEKVEITLPNAAERITMQQGGVTTGDLASAFSMTNNRLDPRQSNVNPALVVSSQNSAPSVPGLTNSFNLSQALINAAVPYNYILTDFQELTLAPGDAMQWFGNSLNSEIVVNIVWRERALEDSEKF